MSSQSYPCPLCGEGEFIVYATVVGPEPGVGLGIGLEIEETELYGCECELSAEWKRAREEETLDADPYDFIPQREWEPCEW